MKLLAAINCPNWLLHLCIHTRSPVNGPVREAVHPTAVETQLTVLFGALFLHHFQQSHISNTVSSYFHGIHLCWAWLCTVHYMLPWKRSPCIHCRWSRRLVSGAVHLEAAEARMNLSAHQPSFILDPWSALLSVDLSASPWPHFSLLLAVTYL